MLKWQRKLLRGIVEKAGVRDANDIRNRLERSRLYAFLVKMTPAFLFAFDKIEKVYIEVSSACNINCPVCPVGEGHVPSKLISWQTYKKIVDLLPDSVWVVNYEFRGEPLMNPDFPKMVKYAHEKGCFTIASTNGMLLDRHIDGLVDSGIDMLRVAVEGPTHDVHVKYRRGSSLEKILNNLRLLVETRKRSARKFPRQIYLQMIVSSHNEKYVAEMENMARELGVDGIFYKTFAPSFGGDYFAGQDVNLAHLPKNPEYIRKNDLRLCPKDVQICILFNGDITTCANDYLLKNISGNIFRAGSFEKVVYSKEFSRIRKKARLRMLDLCRGCPITGDCILPELNKQFIREEEA